MKVIGIITTTLSILVLSPLWRGYTLCKLWIWFVASTFALPTLSIPQAIGISLLVSFLTYHEPQPEDKSKSAEQRMLESVIRMILCPAIALGIGAIVKIWI